MARLTPILPLTVEPTGASKYHLARLTPFWPAEGEDATRKQARDDQKLRFLCKAWDGKPPGVPPDLCAKVGPWSRLFGAGPGRRRGSVLAYGLM